MKLDLNAADSREKVATTGPGRLGRKDHAGLGRGSGASCCWLGTVVRSRELEVERTWKHLRQRERREEEKRHAANYMHLSECTGQDTPVLNYRL